MVAADDRRVSVRQTSGRGGDTLLISVVESVADGAVAAEAGRIGRSVATTAANVAAIELRVLPFCEDGREKARVGPAVVAQGVILAEAAAEEGARSGEKDDVCEEREDSVKAV